MSGKYAPNADYYAELARQAIAEAKAKFHEQEDADEGDGDE